MSRVLILDTELTSLKEPEVFEVAWAELHSITDLAGDANRTVWPGDPDDDIPF